MSRDWDGLALQNEFAQMLGDESTAGKAKVLKWINDTFVDMAKKKSWSKLRIKAKKILVVDQEQQSLLVAAPDQPTAAIAAGGSLTDTYKYKVYITFVQSFAGETIPSEASAEVLATAVNKTIDITDIGISAEENVTKRNVYISVDSGDGYGDIFYHSTINNNVDTTLSITAETSSLIEAPDVGYIRQIDGDLFIESENRKLFYRDLDTMTAANPEPESGTPDVWSDMGEDEIILSPYPSTAWVVSFYFFRYPAVLYADKTSKPTFPITFKESLREGVRWQYDKYYDRAGKIEQEGTYKRQLKEDMDDNTARRGTSRVQDVVGDADGFRV